MRAQGMTFKAIADALGVGRGMIAGAVRRHKLVALALVQPTKEDVVATTSASISATKEPNND